MNASFCFLLLVLTTVHVVAADRPGRPVMLGRASSLRPGTLLREKREVRTEAGKVHMQQAQAGSDFSCRFIQRVNFVRRLLGGDNEEVQVREQICELTNYNGNAPPPGDQAGPLVNRTLRVRKSVGRWEYTLADGKPTPEQQKFLNDFAFTSLLLEIPSACLSNQTRKPGETWQIDITAPRGKAYGWVVADGIQCTLDSVDDRPDGPHATIHFVGTFRMERPMNFVSKIEVSFDGTLVRRLTDMLDVDTKIAGRLKNESLVNDLDGKAAQLTLDFPYTLTRSVALEPK